MMDYKTAMENDCDDAPGIMGNFLAPVLNSSTLIIVNNLLNNPIENLRHREVKHLI